MKINLALVAIFNVAIKSLNAIRENEILAHRIGISLVSTHVRFFYLTHQN